MEDKLYKIICFDYYGTLVEMNHPFQRIQEWICDKVSNDLPIYPYMLRKYAKLTTQFTYMRGDERLVESLRYACEKWQVKVDSEAFHHFLFSLFVNAKVYPDVQNIASRLQDRYIVGVTSNADNDIINASIEKNHFKFDFVITSEDAKAEKPSPDFFLYTLKKLGVPKEEVLLIGDSWKDDVWGANRIGMDCIWINRDNKTVQDHNIILKAKVSSLMGIMEILEGKYVG